MKPKHYLSVAILMTLLNLSFTELFAQSEVKSTGIGVRGSYWKMSNKPTQIVVKNYGEDATVNIGGAGGWLYLFSRINYNLSLELSVGATARVEEETNDYHNTEADVFTIMPVLLGLRYDLFSPQNRTSLQPYIAFGAGPYWMTNVFVKEQFDEEEVTLNTDLERGGYVGGGFNFMLSDWFAVNFDVKYHFIDFNVNHEYSGYEYGLGISVMWGKYRE